MENEEGQGAKVDLGALLAPEGFSDTDSSATNMLPDAEDVNDIESQEGGEEAGHEEGVDPALSVEGGSADKRKASGSNSADGGDSAGAVGLGVQLQSAIKEVFGPAVNIQFGKSSKEVVETLQELFTPKLHPELMRAQQYVDQGGKLEDFFGERNQTGRLLGIKDDMQLMTEVYRQRYGKSAERPEVFWDDEKIASVLKKKEASGSLELEAFEERDKIAKQERARQEENERWAGGNTAMDPTDPEQLRRLTADIDKATEAVIQGGGGKLYGLDLGKAGSQEDLKKLMRHYFTPLDRRGTTPFAKRMMANNAYVQAALLMHMADNGLINSALLDKANGAKESVLRKLGTQPRTSSGGTPRKGFDLDALKRPEGFSSSVRRK